MENPEIIQLNPFKININELYKRLIPYRTVSTRRLCYTNQSVNAV
jgi:hypothetical protein